MIFSDFISKVNLFGVVRVSENIKTQQVAKVQV